MYLTNKKCNMYSTYFGLQDIIVCIGPVGGSMNKRINVVNKTILYIRVHSQYTDELLN